MADSRKAFKIYRAVKDGPGQKSYTSRAAETDSGSEPEDNDPDLDKQDDEDARDIGLAMTYAEMRKSMAAVGCSQKAINRKMSSHPSPTAPISR